MLDEKTLRRIDDFRANSRPIPSLSKGIEILVLQGLEESTRVLKEENTNISKEAIRFDDLTLHTREHRGGSSIINLPYKATLEHGLKNLDKLDVWIQKHTP